VTISPAAKADLPAVRHLLEAAHLPLDDVEETFPRLGFEQISRADVPESVQTSVEFQSACPASATVMRKQLV